MPFGSDWNFLGPHSTFASARASSPTLATTGMRFALPRPPRYSLPGISQHVMQCGLNRQPIFVHVDDSRISLACLHAIMARHATAVHA